MKATEVKLLVRECVRNLKPYSSARDEFKDLYAEKIFLDANENPYNNGLNRYPDPQQKELKNKLGKLKNVKPENILLGNGSDEVIDLIMRSFCEPQKDKIITLPPTYGMYRVLADINQVFNKTIPLKPNFQPDLENILKCQSPEYKIIFICSPNNPTANSLDKKAIERILYGFQGLVVIDEAYIDFSQEKSWLDKLSEFPNLIVTQTLSKSHARAGIRLGICYASEFIISILNRIKPPYNINTLTQKAAIEHLKNISETQQQTTIIIEERKELLPFLKTLSFVIDVYHSDANFILIKVDDANLRYKQLISQDIVVRNLSKNTLCENTLRITVGTHQENQELRKVLKSLEVK